MFAPGQSRRCYAPPASSVIHSRTESNPSTLRTQSFFEGTSTTVQQDLRALLQRFIDDVINAQDLDGRWSRWSPKTSSS